MDEENCIRRIIAKNGAREFFVEYEDGVRARLSNFEVESTPGGSDALLVWYGSVMLFRLISQVCPKAPNKAEPKATS